MFCSVCLFYREPFSASERYNARLGFQLIGGGQTVKIKIVFSFCFQYLKNVLNVFAFDATAESKRPKIVLRGFIGTADQNLKGAIDDGFLIYFSYLSRLQLGTFECSSKAADRVLCN